MESANDNLESSIKLIKQKIQSQLEEIDLMTRKPPFIASNFASWRKKEFILLKKQIQDQNFINKQTAILKFIEVVDNDLFYDFTKMIKRPYFEIVFYENYGVPKDIDISNARQEYQLFKEVEQLSIQIAEWCKQIEIASDIVERAEIYGFFNCSKKEKDIYYDLKKQLQGHKKQNFCQYSLGLMKKSATWSLTYLSDFVLSKSLTLSNISFGALLLYYYQIMGPARLGLSMLLPNVSMRWLFGGLVGSFALNKIAKQMQKNEVANQILEVAEIFKNIQQNLIDFNDKCEFAIKQCAQATTEAELEKKKENLNKKIKELLYSTDKFKEINDRALNIKKIVETELDNGWTLVQTEDEVQDIEDLDFDFNIDENQNDDEQNEQQEEPIDNENKQIQQADLEQIQQTNKLQNETKAITEVNTSHESKIQQNVVNKKEEK